MIERFGDPERGGFFTTSDDHEQLIARRKDVDDHPIPSGNSSAALGLLRLAALTGERRYEEQAEGVLRLFARPPAATPTPSPTCCGRSTSTSRRPRRWRWSATTLAELAAVVRAASAPSGPRRRPRGHRAAGADARAHRRRRQAGRLRLRELRLPAPVTDPRSSDLL